VIARARWPVAAAALMAATGLAWPASAASRAARKTAKVSVAAPAPRATPPGPDAALYAEAKKALDVLRASPKRQNQRNEWERVVMRFRKVPARYPQSGYSDDALLAVGDIYRHMARKFSLAGYEDDAVAAYKSLVAEYPASRKGEPALFAVFQIAQARNDRKRMAEAAESYLQAFPDAPRAKEVKALMKKGARRAAVAEAPLPSPPPPGLAQVFNLRFWSGESSTRVVLDVEKEVRYRSDRIANPDRLWIDLEGTRLHPNLVHRSFPVGDGLLEQVRIGQNKDDVVRVVLDFRNVKDHSIFYLENPLRLVVDVRGNGRPMVAQAERPLEKAPPLSSVWTVHTPPPSPAPATSPVPSPTPKPDPEVDSLPPHRVAEITAPEPPPAPMARRAPPPRVVIEGTEPPKRGASTASRAPAAPLPPQANRAGSYSLARQLGLGARRIVIDAGHGGHDPGTIGRGGLQEKDLVLDVALRVQRLLRDELGAEVVMTRSTDVFIPLEERTAIANSKGADLFLSIHANSSRNPRAKGIETYFLNFAADPHAESVAARENAISAATLKDLQNLVKAITLNSKIDESRDFAASVQEAMVENMRTRDPDIQDRGVHTAPFYVLIGANMPSVLAEIAFVSHPDEEKLLKGGDHRERIAWGLFEGVRTYLEALNRTQTRQLTEASRGSTVASGDPRR
jgi:N-acetylmuramoyl-L-alanine amidase